MKIFQDHAIFLRFIGTFLFLAFNDSSSSSLLKGMPSHEISSDITKTYSLPCHTYVASWREIAKSGVSQIMILNFDVSRDAGAYPFWQKLLFLLMPFVKTFLHVIGILIIL